MRVREDAELMDEEKNIRLTLFQPPEEAEEEISIDFYLIWDYVRRFFSLWLALAVALGSIAGAAGIGIGRYFGEKEAVALVGFSDVTSNIEEISSQSVVEDALHSLGYDTSNVQSVRENLSFRGVLPEKYLDQRTLFNKLLEKNSNLEVVNTLLDAEYEPSSYIVSLNYREAGYSREDGIELLYAILDAYLEYFNNNYNESIAMGSAVNVVDYTEYDYAEAVSIFSSTLDTLSDYIDSIQGEDTGSFRSVTTGYTFADLSRTLTMLKQVDLDRVSSYVQVNSVTVYGADYVISHYDWLIENTRRLRAVQETKLASLTESIQAYEKDPVIFAVSEGNTLAATQADVNAYYDSMIQQKLETQRVISTYDRMINYYESMIAGFRENANVRPENVAKTTEYLSQLNSKLNQLIEDVKQTVDEYYDTAAYTDRVRILMPPVAEGSGDVKRNLMLYVGVTEAVLLLGYFGYAAICGIRAANPRKNEEKPEEPAGTGLQEK